MLPHETDECFRRHASRSVVSVTIGLHDDQFDVPAGVSRPVFDFFWKA
jgi:hypothetical protein